MRSREAINKKIEELREKWWREDDDCRARELLAMVDALAWVLCEEDEL